MSTPFSFEHIEESATFLREQGFGRAHVGAILGSGLGAFAETLSDKTFISYSEIPGFAASKVQGHAGRLVQGNLPNGQPVLVMQGRVHYYEGHPIAQVVFPLRVMLRLGVKQLVITNAAGGISDHQPGDLVLLRDHLNLMSTHPLIGHNDDRLGTRFPDMSRAYSPRLRALAQEIATAQGGALREGVYAAMSGPTYETPAEIRMLRAMGADLVGMSTVPEVIAGVHMGAEILGISCVTNLAAGVSEVPIDHSHVEEVAAKARKRFVSLVEGVLQRLTEAA